MEKIRCRTGGGHCYGHAGSWLVSKEQMGADIIKMNPDKWKKGTLAVDAPGVWQRPL